VVEEEHGEQGLGGKGAGRDEWEWEEKRWCVCMRMKRRKKRSKVDADSQPLVLLPPLHAFTQRDEIRSKTPNPAPLLPLLLPPPLPLLPHTHTSY
jgi:hypothetical protein